MVPILAMETHASKWPDLPLTTIMSPNVNLNGCFQESNGSSNSSNAMSLFPRSAGVLLHITSLPGPYGVGDLGESAYRFVDFLAEAGQQIWQLLPLGPSIQCDSPYSSYSAFAGNPLLISPSELVAEGYLAQSDLESISELPSQVAADYVSASQLKIRILDTAFERFRLSQACEEIDEYEAFCTKQQWWLRDFALFSALIQHYGNDGWLCWDKGLVHRDRETLAQWRQILAPQIEREQFVQFLFFRQWKKLKEYANCRNIRLFGDMPIFVSRGSADVWANQNLFSLDSDGQPTAVAGVPPDYFSESGQLWGNPLYRWDRIQETGYRWWIQRFRMAFELYDMLRIDHFRGFEAYWEVPAGSPTAKTGKWVPGPGAALFETARKQLGELAIVAEDLGMITKEVHAIRDSLGFPGMRVLQFGFDSPADGYHRPENYPANSVAYTGTHDNDTVVGWYRERKLNSRQSGKRDLLERYLSADTQESTLHWQCMAMVMNSASHTAIVPMQDVLGLGNEARMNLPGTAHGNWRWRLLPEQLNEAVASQLRVLTEHSRRLQPISIDSH